MNDAKCLYCGCQENDCHCFDELILEEESAEYYQRVQDLDFALI